MRHFENASSLCTALAATVLALTAPAFGQTPADHAKHHPAAGGSDAAPARPAAPAGMPMPGGNPIPAASGSMNPAPGSGAMGGNPSPVLGGGGMGAGMGEMMKEMGKPPSKEVYPSLMALPELSPEKRTEMDGLASEQINEGVARLSAGSESLTRATQAGDQAAMEQSVGLMRDGLAELEAGLAARRVLSEGKAPRNVALNWFKREMNLALPSRFKEPRLLLGVAPFHFFTMVLLIAFALAMVVMYFYKMRRASALFGRLDPDDSKPPPPGAAPPLAGKDPPGGKDPPPSKDSKDPPPTLAEGEATGRIAKAPGEAPVPPVMGSSSGWPAHPPAVSKMNSVPPVAANWRGLLRVASIVAETPTVKTFRLLPLSTGDTLPFTFVPGQFLNVAFGIGGARMNRSYSISSSPTKREYVELTVRREPRGAVSRHMVDLLKVGDPIEAGGPIGRFTFTGTEANSIVLVSAGVGITPMVSITRYLTEKSWPGDIFFVYTCRTPADFIFADDVATLQRLNPKLHVAVTLSKAEGTDWRGSRGRITKEWLTQAVPDLASRTIHLCGPPSMMDAIKAILTEVGVPPDRLKTEAFGTPKPAPAAHGTTAKPAGPATGPLVTFSKNNKSANIRTDQTILELSEELSIPIEFSCRVGTCGICKVKMTSGEVEMAIEDALEPAEKSNGIILACQAKPKGEVAVEA